MIKYREQLCLSKVLQFIYLTHKILAQQITNAWNKLEVSFVSVGEKGRKKWKGREKSLAKSLAAVTSLMMPLRRDLQPPEERKREKVIREGRKEGKSL